MKRTIYLNKLCADWIESTMQINSVGTSTIIKSLILDQIDRENEPTVEIDAMDLK